MSQSIKLPKLLQEGCVLQRGEKQEFGDGTNHRQSLRLHFRRKFTEPNVMRKEHLRQKFPVKKQVVLMC